MTRSKIPESILISLISAGVMADTENSIINEVFYKKDHPIFQNTDNLIIFKYSLTTREQMQLWVEGEEENIVEIIKNLIYKKYGKKIQVDVHQNTSEVRNFCLPILPYNLENLSLSELISKVKQETGDDSSLLFFLPSEIIAKALVDKNFRKYLIAHPNLVLKDWGYNVNNFTCIIHEDTETKKNIIYNSLLGSKELQTFNENIFNDEKNINNLRNSEGIETRSIGGCAASCHAGGTTRCCATGTC